MIQRRLIGPSFTCREWHVQLIDTRRCGNCALGASIGHQNDPRGVFLGHLVRRRVMALAGGVLEFRRQGDPQLKAFRFLQGRSGMPNAAAGAHPFDAACGKNSFYAGGLLILDRALMKTRERCDSQMRMPPERGPSSTVISVKSHTPTRPVKRTHILP